MITKMRAFGWVTMTLALCAPAWAARETVVLGHRESIWRIHKVWRTEDVRLDSGKRAHVDPWNPREGEEKDGKTTYRVRLTDRVVTTPAPAANWREVDFDDAMWTRQPGSLQPDPYQELALYCIRGKFTVTDPAQVKGLKLAMKYHGGVVVWLNGKELTRAHMPAGPVTPDTLAEDYPREAHVTPDGVMLHLGAWNRPKRFVERHAMRMRALKDVAVPVSMLRKGTNVLAVEIHRAPAVEAMFTTKNRKPGRFDDMSIRRTYWWNRNAVYELKLTVPYTRTPAVVPNTTAPRGLHVWNHTVIERVNRKSWADAHEPLGPVHMRGPRNGSYSGQVVVSSDKPIDRLSAAASDLQCPRGGVIAAANVSVRYPQTYTIGRSFVGFDTLAARPAEGAKMQPVWVTVRVPKDAVPGDYTGTLTVKASDEKPVTVPVVLKVLDWTLPDAHDFRTHLDIIQSPVTVAMQYGDAMWSEAHWKHIERSFALFGQLGNKVVYLPIIRRTHFGNPHGMLRWIKQPDGSYKHDFSIIERYLDLAVKHLGKVPVVIVYLWDIDSNPTKGHRMSGKRREGAKGVLITVLDPATGKLTEAVGPQWGTPESQTFWKPVVDGLRARLAKRGLAGSMHFGLGMDVKPDQFVVSDLKAVAPDVLWACHSHFFWETVGSSRDKRRQQKVGYMATIGGVIGVFWNPEDRREFYGWHNKSLLVAFGRDEGGTGVAMLQNGEYPCYRLFAEGSMISGRLYTVRYGWTPWGYKYYLTPEWEHRSEALYSLAAEVAEKLEEAK